TWNGKVASIQVKRSLNFDFSSATGLPVGIYSLIHSKIRANPCRKKQRQSASNLFFVPQTSPSRSWLRSVSFSVLSFGSAQDGVREIRAPTIPYFS
ncbi:MAG: hypothetical protein ACYTBX_20070, partial [Planctomycetota bacterium]